jgi:hypothetical protein
MAEKTEVALSWTDLQTAGALNDWQLAGLKGIIQAGARLAGDNEVIITKQKSGKYEYGGFPNRMSFPTDENDELAAEKYSKPLMVKVPFSCQKYKGIIPLSDESMRNSIERGNLGSWTMQQAGPRIALDIEEYGLQSDTDLGSSDELGKIDGLIKQVTDPRGNSNDARGVPVLFNPETAEDFDDAVLFKMRAALPARFWRDIRNMRVYCSPLQEAVYQYKQISRYGNKGYEYLEEDKRYKMTFAGVEIFPVPGMPDDVSILTHSKNILWFIEQDVQWEYEREAKKDRWLYHLRYWFDVAFAVPGSVVAHTNLALPVLATS